jgi:hypothetical protein
MLQEGMKGILSEKNHTRMDKMGLLNIEGSIGQELSTIVS